MPKEDEQTVDEFEVDPELLEKSRRPYPGYTEEETIIVSAHPGFKYIESDNDNSFKEQEGHLDREGAGLEEVETKLERPAHDLGAADTQIAPPGHDLNEAKTRLAPPGYVSDDSSTVHGHPGYDTDIEVEVFGRPVHDSDFEATALAQPGYEADVEAEVMGQLQHDSDFEATAVSPADSGPPNLAVADAQEASRRVSQELDVQFGNILADDDVTAKSPAPAGIVEGSVDDQISSTTPVIQVPVKQVGSNVQEAPRELPKRPVDESRQATIALGYEVPESVVKAVPLTRVKEPPKAQEEPFIYMDAPSQESPQAVKPSKRRRRRRRVSPGLIIACVVCAICVAAGIVIAFFAFNGRPDSADAPRRGGDTPSTNGEKSPTKALVGTPPSHVPSAAPSVADGSTSTEAGLAVDGSPPNGEGESSTTSELPDESILPITFEEGGYENVEVDEDALERIVAVMLDQPTLRFEVIGYASLDECDSVEEVLFISARRARKAVRIIRQHGPTGKRFVTRGARPDDDAPEDAPGPVTVLRVLNR